MLDPDRLPNLETIDPVPSFIPHGFFAPHEQPALPAIRPNQLPAHKLNHSLGGAALHAISLADRARPDYEKMGKDPRKWFRQPVASPPILENELSIPASIPTGKLATLTLASELAPDISDYASSLAGASPTGLSETSGSYSAADVGLSLSSSEGGVDVGSGFDSDGGGSGSSESE